MKSRLVLGAALLIASPAMAESFTVVERATTDATAHVGKAADNRGDVLTFTNDVYDAANKTRIGADQGFCIRVAVGKAYDCQWTLALAAGQIMVAGPFLDAGDSTLTVTGGTGKYSGARGEMRLHARDAKGSAYDFKYTLIPARP